MSTQTELSREQLKANRTIVPLKELKLWDKNPREVINQDTVINDMKGAQTIPLLVMSDGTILGGNTRYQAMEYLHKPDVWVSVVEFELEAGSYVAYVNGERDNKTFKSIEDGMKHYALKNNQEYARYLDAEVVEIAYGSALDLSDYTFRSEDGVIMTLQDILNDSDGTDPSISVELQDESTIKDVETIQPKEDKKPRIAFKVEFPYELVRATSTNDYETWLNEKMDEMMLSMLDQFKQVKDRL